MPNRLASETSPYLLQHANNPVDWYPWGQEALGRAQAENKPILLSIGYAACHWCHVMEHESFEDESTAALMNERFVNIKVDREERPDLDAIYMQAVQAMTGHGGWPMTVFLTPEGVPFYGGTYFPAEPRFGMPTFKRILTAVSDSYQNKPADVARAAGSVREMYDSAKEPTRSGGAPGAELLDRAYRALADDFDEEHGGFGGAPKFPATMALDFLLRYWARTGTERALSMVKSSFLHMAHGGIYDQIGGGFARYTVDANWLTPHFEKMLYDNALLVRLGAHLWQATGDGEIRRIVEQTIDWAIREMRSPDGGFYSSYDADSEGHEGKFYLWDAAELDEALGTDAAVMREYWGVTQDGNFEGRNILHLATSDRRVLARRFSLAPEELKDIVWRSKRALYEIRKRRVWPGLDDKVLASWNGLMVRGIAEAARALGNDEYRKVAIEAGSFLFEKMVRDGRVLRSYKNGHARIAGVLEDYASLALAALSLYELTFDAEWLARARELGDTIVRLFWGDDVNAFFDTASDHEALVMRPRDVTDNATPSGTSLAAELLARLAELYHDVDARRRATWIIETQLQAMQRYPSAFGHALGVTDMLIHGAIELAIVGEIGAADFTALERAAAGRYVPSLVVAGGAPSASSDIALLADRKMRDGHATAYVCRSYTCQAPAMSVDVLVEQLESVGRGVSDSDVQRQ
jgi:uncharacterized protein YyaL (SSP411 family)